LIIALYDTISNLKNIQKQAHYTCEVEVLRRSMDGTMVPR
jgi:hypothetical protein